MFLMNKALPSHWEVKYYSYENPFGSLYQIGIKASMWIHPIADEQPTQNQEQM